MSACTPVAASGSPATALAFGVFRSAFLILGQEAGADGLPAPGTLEPHSPSPHALCSQTEHVGDFFPFFSGR